MKATRPLQSCVGYQSTQSTRQQLYISSTHPRSAFHNAPQPLSIRTRQFSSTHAPKASQSPPRNSANKFIEQLIRETRAPETKQRQQEATTAPIAQNWTDMLSEARKTSTSPQPRPFAPPTTPNLQSTTQTVNEALNHTEAELKGTPMTLRLRPTLGRTVDGLYGDPTRGFRQMERKCTENNVRGDSRSQEKHVRRGQRRKILRIQRWRKLFMEGFKKELDTVQRMRKQGW
jgi:small subunit ribosomal protein MRP21